MRYLRTATHMVTLTAAMTGLWACTVLPKPKAAPTVYRLSVPQSGQSAQTQKLVQEKIINIEYPEASKAINGTDIVLSPDGRRLTAAGGASWSEAVPSLLRNLLIDTLAMHSNVTGVIPKGSTRVPYRLSMDVRRFESVFDNGEDLAPKAVVQINLLLTETATRHLIASHTVQSESRADARAVSSIVEAQDKAAGKAMRDIVKWLDVELENNRF